MRKSRFTTEQVIGFLKQVEARMEGTAGPSAGLVFVGCWRPVAGDEKSPHRCGLFHESMVAGEGIEPPTRGFSIPCSTN
jgi:hypothetical protein